MPVNLSVKSVPDDLAQRLRDRAAGNHRSLQRELVAILEEAVSGALPHVQPLAPLGAKPAGRPIEDVMGELRAIFPRTRGGGPASVDLVRQMRDIRHGERPAKRRNRAAS